MAEDVIVPTGEGTPIPGESAEIQDKARDLGWRPKEEYEGDPDRWVDAKEFVARQPLFEKIEELKNAVWHQKQDYKALAQHYQNVAKTEYDRALKTLQDQRKIAAKEGDTEQVVEISEQIENLQQPQAPAVTNDLPQEYITWESKNSWYSQDQELHAAADSLAVAYRKTNLNATLDEVLKHVETQVKTIFPNKFGGRRTAPTVESGSPAPTRKSGRFGESDLNDVERRVMNNLVERKLMTKEKYIADLAKAKGQA